jgi:tetratricopeptide (TPR) repeat protein
LPLAPEQAAALRAALPKTSAAAEAYADGLARMAAYDYRGARDALERAVVAEGDFALAHLALSRALTALGYDKRALEEAARALDLSTALAREQRLVIEAQHKVAGKSWDAASELYRTLFGFFPDNLDYGLAYARAQVLGGKRNEAFATLDRLRAAPRTGVDDARIDLMEAFMAAKTADIHRRLAAATEAKRKADALGAPWIGADARVAIGEARLDLGEAELGARDLAEARALFEELGDLASVANVYRQQGKLERKRGDVTRARELEAEGLALARQVGDAYTIAGIVTSMSISHALAGELREAEAGFDEARATFDAIQDAEGVAHNTGNAAYMRMLRGELGGVRADFTRALTIHREIGMKMGLAGQTINAGYAAYLEGDLDASRALLADAMAQARAIGAAELLWDVLDKEARRLVAKDDVPGALRTFDEAARVATQDGAETARAEIDVARARLLLEQGRTADAVTLARAAAARFESVRASHDEALARAVLVRALVRSGDADEATAAFTALDRVLPASELLEAQIEAKLAAAERAAARGDRDLALALVADARARAERSRVMPFAFEAALTEASLLRGAPRAEAIARIAADAQRHGFSRVARRAVALRASP